MEKNEKKRKSVRDWSGRLLLSLLLVLAVCGGVAILYSVVTAQVINLAVQSMDELTLHDEASILKSVEYRWEMLEGSGEECRQAKCSTISELLELLRRKEHSMGCIDLALVDGAGDLYFGSLSISRDENITGFCRGGEGRFVARYDGAGQNVESRKECLLFGSTIEPFTVEGKIFTHIVCRIHIDTLENELKLDSYGGKGYSSVFDRDGNYIVSLSHSHSALKRDNFFRDLAGNTLEDGGTVEDVQRRIAQGEAFAISLRSGSDRKLMRFTPMAGLDWYFVMAVSRSVFEDQCINILRIVLLIFVVMGAAVVLILLLALRNRQSTVRARMEQQYQKELSAALKLAEQANRAKTTFLNNMSHDIRTPMNAIIGFTALAITHIDEKEQVRDYLSKIGQSSNHLLSLINDVLDMSRIESGKMVIAEKPENLADILHGVCNIIQTDIQAKHLSLFIDAVDVTDEDIYCDRLRLNQILLNLLSNAMKFTPAGGSISVRLTECKSSRPGFGDYELRVKDTGIGMSEEFAATIFEPFTRERTSTVSGIQGTGLGMSITKNIVDMMGGTIQLQSKQGEGTEFTVRLSFRLQEGQREPERLAAMEGCRALVVDDDMEGCQNVCQMLRSLGLRADWTLYGKEAVARAREAQTIQDGYGLYIIDWQMPDLNGVETARQIRKLAGSEVPILLLSAYDWADMEKEARTAGVTGFIGKPLFQSELCRTLRRCCGENAQGETSPETEVSFEGRRLLLVEDNELNREIATEILQEVGFRIETAENGQEAVDIVKASEPGYFDAVLMDVQMPVMDGYTATKAIRALGDPSLSRILIIAMTANAFEEDRQAALQAGMNAHVGKPIDIPVLMDTLKQFLGRAD